MTTLVVGDSPRTVALCEALGAGGAGNVIRCAEVEAAFAVLAAREQPVRWAMVEGRIPPTESLRLLQALAALDPPAGVSLLWHREGGYGPEELRPLLCALESGKDGQQILRCALRQARHDPARHPLLAHIAEETPVGFAYVAPTRRRA